MNMPMMQDDKTQAKMPKDTTYYLYKYYAARMAYDGKDLDLAISMFRELLDGTEPAPADAAAGAAEEVPVGELDEALREVPGHGLPGAHGHGSGRVALEHAS